MTREVPSNHRERSSAMQDQRPRQVANQLIVKLKRESNANQTARRRVIKSLPEGSTILRDFDEFGFALIELPNGVDPFTVAQTVETDRDVNYAEANLIDSGTTP